MKEVFILKDLNCSVKIHNNKYPDVKMDIDFKLALINTELVESVECKEYQIKGISYGEATMSYDEDTCCDLRYKILKGEIQILQNQNITKKVNTLRIEDIM